MPRTSKQQALRAYRDAMAEEHRAQDRALAAANTDDAITAWLQAMQATRRASHALRSVRSGEHTPGDRPDAHAD